MTGIGAFGMALLLAAAPAPAPANDPGRPLADRIEVAFRACALQLTRRTYLAETNAKELAEVGIRLNPAAPPEVTAMASRLFGTSGIYAAVEAPDADVWMVASATVPACKVTVANSALSLSARTDWAAKLRSTQGWAYEPTRSGMNGNLMRDAFTLNAQRPGTHMIVLLDGPNTVWQNGKGIQMIMTVAVENAKAP